LREWIRTFRQLPPEEFLDSYELICSGLYFGFRTREQDESTNRKRGKAQRAQYWFGDASLLEVKSLVDARLAAITRALRRRRREASA